MSAATISPPATAPRTRDRDADHPRHPSPEPKRPWTWALLESLAYAGGLRPGRCPGRPAPGPHP